MPSSSSFPLILFIAVVAITFVPCVQAFGAGDVPDFAYLNDKAFRHGDLEATLENLAKIAGGGGHHHGGGGGLLGQAMGMLASAAAGGGGAKFTKNDIKRVYFGNWLRDYSQAMDIAGLSKLSAKTIVSILSVLGFMTFGYATNEFEITEERLGVYLTVEHIDNPKGYAEKEGDARKFHPKLRPPVDPRELEIDPNNGMKNYMATENRGWDTSTAHIRRTLEACIQHGRNAGGQEGPELWEAYRLLGTGLHTLEDLLAHSNWLEISLRKLGHREVFCHVGDNVVVNTPNGPAPPLVTGTFGSADFMHSLMGEATDHLSEASLNDLSKKIHDAKNQAGRDGNPLIMLKKLFSKLPSSGGQNTIEQGEQLSQQAYNFDPNKVAPEDVRKQLWAVLVWRDGVMRQIERTIENIPGLSELVEQLTEALNVYIYTVLEPYLTPLLKDATGALQQGSQAVIESDDQYEVFTNPNASDPSHSLLSKDHFNNILNTPAGKVAIVVVEHSVNLIVEAWGDRNRDPRRVIDQILEAFHHPYYANGRSQVQNHMTETLQRWFQSLSRQDQQETLRRITKESVRNGENKRIGGDDTPMHGHSHGANVGGGGNNYGSTQGGYGSGGGHGRQQSGGYGQQSGGYGQQSGGYGQQSGGYGQQSGGYGQGSGSYGSSGRNEYGGNSGSQSYGSSGRNEYNSGSQSYGSSGRQDSGSQSYGSSGRHESGSQSYGSSGRNESGSQSYGSSGRNEYGSGSQSYGSSGRHESGSQSYGSSGRNEYESGSQSYGSGRHESGSQSYGSSGRHESGSQSYGSSGRNEGSGSQSYGSSGRHESGSQSYGSSGRNEYGSGSQSYGSSGRQDYGGDSGRNEYGSGSQSYGSSGRHESGSQSYGSSGRQGHHSGGYGGDESSGGYNQGGNQGGYGRSDSSSYGSSDTRYGGQSGGYGQSDAYGSSNTSGGYGSSGYGRSDDTYGVDRLNINDDERPHHSGGHHKKKHHQEDY